MIHTLKVSIHSRGRGHSATAGVAYRCGVDLIDLPDGKAHEYGHRKDEVIKHGIACGDFDSPQEWANAIEESETRINSQFYRDIQLGLPHELDEDKQIQLAREWAVEKANEYGTSACWAVHRPSEAGDERNCHAHILLATRKLTAERSFVGGEKHRSIDAAALKRWHDEWDGMQTQACKEAGVDFVPIPDPNGHPGVHLGPQATAFERQVAARKDARRRTNVATQRRQKRRRQKPPKRRSIPDLLLFTGGITDRGKEWLIIKWLVKSVRSAYQAVERTGEEIKDALRPAAKPPAQPAAERVVATSSDDSETTAKSSASAPKPEAPAPVPQPDRRRKRRRRKRAPAQDKSPSERLTPPSQPDPTLLDAYEAGWSDAHKDFAEFVDRLASEDREGVGDHFLDWTDENAFRELPEYPSETETVDAYESGVRAANVRVDRCLLDLPDDIQERIQTAYLDWKRGGDPVEPLGDLDNNVGSTPGNQP